MTKVIDLEISLADIEARMLKNFTADNVRALQDEVTSWTLPAKSVFIRGQRTGKASLARHFVGAGLFQTIGRRISIEFGSLRPPKKAKGYRKHVRRLKQETRRCTK